jgi:hypothetical protein
MNLSMNKSARRSPMSMTPSVRFVRTLLIVLMVSLLASPQAAWADTQGPNSAGAGADNASVGTITWSNPGNITASDDSRATATLGSGDVTHYLVATGFGFSIPGGSTIDGIEVSVEKSHTQGGTANMFSRDNQVRIVKGGTIGTAEDRAQTGVNWPLNTDATVTYGGAADLWGETWAATDINAGNFGVAISATGVKVGGGQPGTSTARVDHMQITVHFTPTGGCVRNAPDFTMGADKDIPVDGTAVYTLSITNNDTSACSSTTFDTTIIDKQGDLTSFGDPGLSATTVTIAPQATNTSVTLTVIGNGTGTDGDFIDVTVEVKDDTDHAGQQQTDLVRTTIAAIVGDGFNLRRSRENLCHSCHKTDLNRSSSDPDWDEAIKTHNSNTTDSSKWSPNGWGIAGGKYGEFQCITCHTTHFTQNIFLIRERVSTADGSVWNSTGLTNAPVDFRELSNTPGDALYAMGDDSDNHSTSTRVCEACHTITNYHRYDVTGLPAENKNHNNAKDCTECHNHRNAFKGLGSCVDCHNIARTKTKGTSGTIRQVTGSGGDYERFSRHVINGTTPGTEIVTIYDCTLCHREGSTADANPVDGVHNDAGGLINLRNVDSRDTGWDIDNKSMDETMRTDLDTFCLACHDSDGANDIAVTGPSSSPAFALPPTGIQNLTPFNDNDNLNSNNAQRDGFVRSRVIDVKSQFDPGTGGIGAGYNGNPSQHAVLGNRYSIINASWTAAAWTSHQLRNGTAMNSARETATLHCSDCHLTESDAHGAENAWHMLMNGVSNDYTGDMAMGGVALDEDPTILVCYKCHNQNVYSTTADPGARVDHDADSKWPLAGYGTGSDAALLGPQCLNCHAGDGFGNIHGVSGQYDPFLTGQSGAPGNLQGTRFTRYRFMPGAWMLWSPGGGGSGGATGDDNSWNTTTNGTCYFASSSSWSNCTQHSGSPGSTNADRVTTNYGRPVKY